MPLSIRRRFASVLWRKLSVTSHTYLMVAGAAMAGVGANNALAAGGVLPIDVRYPLAVVVSFGCFFLFVHLWLRYVRSWLRAADWARLDADGCHESWSPLEREPFLGRRRGTYLLAVAILFVVFLKPSLRGDHPSDFYIHFLWWRTVIAAACGFGFCAMSLVWEAPSTLTEAAFRAVQSAGLLGPTPATDLEDWRRWMITDVGVRVLVIVGLTVIGSAALEWHGAAAHDISHLMF